MINHSPLIVVSLATPPPAQEKLNGLTFRYAGEVKLDEAYKIENPVRRRQNTTASIILLIMLLVLWIFSFNCQ